MYLSNRDIKWAIDQNLLIIRPKPEQFNSGYDETSIDLHLESIEKGARVWDIQSFAAANKITGKKRPNCILARSIIERLPGNI